MSASSVENPATKHKKAKDPPPEVEEQEGHGEKPRKTKNGKKVDETTASTPPDPDVIQSPAGPAKEKSRKKRKNAGGENVLESSQDVDSEHKKKKKKHRHEDAAEQGDDLQTEGDDSRGKKKKKERKEAAAEDVQQEHEDEGRGGDEGVGDHGIEVQPSSFKKDKKEKKEKKKPKHSEDEGGKPRPKEKSKKKRTRRSSSGFPNPCEDESLSEQARKALEYAFAQFEEPDSWKFHKARQNWILRNIWSDEVMPEKYMPLAMRYLQGMQGGARETLIKSCREAMESPQSVAANATTGDKEEMLPESPEAEDPTEKRTVRFTVNEQDDRDIPSTMNDTERQRAASLLTALTS